MRILFISRAFPPKIGGIEQQNYSISKWLGTLTEVSTMVNPYGKKFLPLFIPWTVLKSIFQIRRHDIVLLGDGVLAITGWILKKMFPETPVVCIVHGLDITYSSHFYQALWPKRFLVAIDLIIAVSATTAREVANRGIPESRIAVIPNGVDPFEKEEVSCRSTFLNRLDADLSRTKILITVGRLVRRKGVNWFIRKVMPLLDHDTIYIVVGEGPEKPLIELSIAELKLENQVFLVGGVDDKDKQALLLKSDLFIQPNIRVNGDIEGFGIAVLEANQAGLFVIASKLEGLCDAIVHGENGYLLDPGTPQIFKNTISNLMLDTEKLKSLTSNAENFCKKNYAWSVLSKIYYQKLEEIIHRTATRCGTRKYI